MRHVPAASRRTASCAMVAGLGGGCAAAGTVPPTLVGTFTADVPISFARGCPNGELIGVRDIRTLTIRADEPPISTP